MWEDTMAATVVVAGDAGYAHAVKLAGGSILSSRRAAYDDCGMLRPDKIGHGR